MSASLERVTAALELREPDRVPTMGMISTTQHRRDTGQEALPAGPLFANRYTARALDAWRPAPSPRSSWTRRWTPSPTTARQPRWRWGTTRPGLTYPPVWRYDDSRERARHRREALCEVTFDGKGNLGPPCTRAASSRAPTTGAPGPSGTCCACRKRTTASTRGSRRTSVSGSSSSASSWTASSATSGGRMGFERFVVAMRKEREFVDGMIRFYTDLYCMIIEAMADAGIPGVIYADDLAYRSGPMLNPRLRVAASGRPTAASPKRPTGWG